MWRRSLRHHEVGSAVASPVSIPYTSGRNDRAHLIGQSMMLKAVLPILADVASFNFERHQEDESER